MKTVCLAFAVVLSSSAAFADPVLIVRFGDVYTGNYDTGFNLAGTKEMTDEQGLKFVFGFIGSMFLFIVVPVVIAEIVMLVFYVTEGKRGPNRFGRDPKGDALNDTP